MNIDPSLYLQNRPPEKRTGGESALDKDAFIKILMTQLQNQDPSNPMDDREFIAQMAQFSSLEQMTNLNETMQKFIKTEEKAQLVSFSQMVGKEVGWMREVKGEDGAEDQVEAGRSVVDSVEVNDKGNLLFILADGKVITEKEVVQIREQNYSNPRDKMISEASTLIGKAVTWTEMNPDTEEEELRNAVVESVSFKDGAAIYHLDNDHSIKGSDIIKVANS
ncbi:flagellar hook assembly protein FlgD [Bacillus tianshenii]|nr:flagellar hook assembly protein FlgD [Bacillus tianshenii]